MKDERVEISTPGGRKVSTTSAGIAQAAEAVRHSYRATCGDVKIKGEGAETRIVVSLELSPDTGLLRDALDAKQRQAAVVLMVPPDPQMNIEDAGDAG